MIKVGDMIEIMDGASSLYEFKGKECKVLEIIRGETIVTNTPYEAIPAFYNSHYYWKVSVEHCKKIERQMTFVY